MRLAPVHLRVSPLEQRVGVAAQRLVPRWGGSWDRVDAFIVDWNKRLASTEGDSMYARLYAAIISTDTNVNETRIHWPTMKRSLEDLVNRYPDVSLRNVAACYACRFNDREYSRISFRRLRDDELMPNVWMRGTDPLECARIARAGP